MNGNAAIGYSTSTVGPTNGITVSGNVGIGTTSPSATLEVAGKIKSENVRATVSATSAISTTSTTWVDTGLSLTVNSGGGFLLILANIPGIMNSAADSSVMFRIIVDGTQVGSPVEHEDGATGYVWSSSLHALTQPSAGSHVIKLQWQVQGGTGSINGSNSALLGSRVLSVVEL